MSVNGYRKVHVIATIKLTSMALKKLDKCLLPQTNLICLQWNCKHLHTKHSSRNSKSNIKTSNSSGVGADGILQNTPLEISILG